MKKIVSIVPLKRITRTSNDTQTLIRMAENEPEELSNNGFEVMYLLLRERRVINREHSLVSSNIFMISASAKVVTSNDIQPSILKSACV